MDDRKSFNCLWTEEEDACFNTTCGNSFAINDGGPIENKMVFCCFCGRHLQEKLIAPEDEEEEDE